MLLTEFTESLEKSESKCKLAFNKWFTNEEWLIIKHKYITVRFNRGDRKCTLVVRKV